MKLRVGHRWGYPAWWIQAANNKVVAEAGRAFDTIEDALTAARALLGAAGRADAHISIDARELYRWALVVDGVVLAVSGESAFSQRAAALTAATRVVDRLVAMSVEVVDDDHDETVPRGPGAARSAPIPAGWRPGRIEAEVG